MTHFTGKAALFALSIISASACASHWSYEGEGAPEHWANWTRLTKPVKADESVPHQH